MRSALALSYRQLTDAHRLVLRRLTLVPGRDTGSELAAVLAAEDPFAVEDTLDLLVDRGLLEETAAGRYAFHDLVRLFAGERLAQEESAPAMETTRHRMADWLLRSASAAGRFFEPPGAPDPWPGDPPPFTFASADDAEHWLTAERAHWSGALPVMAAAGEHEHILHTSQVLYWFSDRWPGWPEWRTLFSHGERAADALGDQAAETRQINCLTWAFSVGAGDYRQAEQHARRALALARAVGDLTQQAWACGYLAAALSSDGRLEEAVGTIEEAVRLFKTTTDRAGTAVAQRVQGTVLRRAGRPREALAVHRSLVDSTSGDAPGFTEFVQALLRFEVAQDLMALGEWHEAVTEFRAVMLPDTHRGAERFRGDALRGLAEALEHCGELSEARERYTQARLVYQAAGAVDDMTRIDEALARLEVA